MIFDDSLKAKYPFATKFFEFALSVENNRFAHGFILSGNNIALQYQMALDIAKYLNCTKDKALGCDCINCNWIKNNAHPAVITISPIDYTEKERKKISIEQIRNLRNALGVTSPYHRVIIITDAKEIESDLPFAVPRISEGAQRNWAPYPLTQGVFEKAPSNAMLKILEEPPGEVTFFFLTRNKDDLLSTIVSRCQNISLVSKELDNEDLSVAAEFLNGIPYHDEAVVLEVAKKFQEMSKEIAPEKILDIMQKSVKENLVQNASDRVFVSKSIELLKKLEEAKYQLKSFVQPQNVVESLFFSLRK